MAGSLRDKAASPNRIIISELVFYRGIFDRRLSFPPRLALAQPEKDHRRDD
jgi:hypothetical protein